MKKKIKIIIDFFYFKYFRIFKKIFPRFYYYVYSNKYFLRREEEYIKVHLNCGNEKFAGYVNIDTRKTNATDCVCEFNKLPFENDAVELVEINDIDLEFVNNLEEILKEVWRILIPGGKILINNKENLFFKKFSEYKKVEVFGFFKSLGYDCLTEESFLFFKVYKLVVAEKEDVLDKNWKQKVDEKKINLNYREKHIHNIILKEFADDILKNKKVLSIGCGVGEIEILNANLCNELVGVDLSSLAIKEANNLKDVKNIKNIKFLHNNIFNLPFEDNSFDSAFSIQVIEHLTPVELNKLFKELQRVLKPGAKILFTTPNKDSYYSPGHIQFFTKGILAKIVDEKNMIIRRLEIDNRVDNNSKKHNLIKLLVENGEAKKVNKTKKICAIGAYNSRYDQLGFHWDGQIRALNQLGYDSLFLDIRKGKNYEKLKEEFLNFNSDYLFLGLSDCLSLITWMKDDITEYRKRGGRVIYWFCDFKKPQKQDFSELIDFIFVTNAGQVEEYREAYNVKNVFYMPQACTPAFMHNLKLEEKNDLAFAGNTFKSVHINRYNLLKKLKKKYKISISSSTRNKISNFYSESKLAFGANQDKNTHLYTSNRFFVAIGCGACYLFEYFPGAEKLVENHKHAVWFHDEKEMLELADYYLKNNEKRLEIRKNAQRLAYGKHTYIIRMQNILDIVEGKTDRFCGFLEN